MPRPATPWTPGPARPVSGPYGSESRPASAFTLADDPAQAQPGDPDPALAALDALPSDCSTVIDALVRGRLVWQDSFSAGKAQSIGGGNEFTRPFGRYLDVAGSVDFADAGGPDGGGCVTATGGDAVLQIREITTELLDGNPAYVPTARLGAIGSDDDHRQASVLVWRHLRGRTIDTPLVLLAATHLRVVVNPDYTLSVQWHEAHGFTDTWHTIRTSTATVPANAWFALEDQWAISPYQYDRGGFFLSRRYQPASDPAIGVAILAAVGVRTRGEFTAVVETTQGRIDVCVPEGTSVGGIGVLVPDGDAARWLYETYFGVALPSAPGDTTESDVGYGHSENVLFADTDLTPQVVGTALEWGDAARWKNVRSFAHSASEGEEPLAESFEVGHVRSSDSVWTEGPTYPADPVVRNSLRNAAMDLYRCAFLKAHATIVAAGAFALVARRVLSGYYTIGIGFNAYLPWVFTGPKPYQPGGESRDATIRPENNAYQLVLKRASGLVEGRGSLGLFEWRTLPGYQPDRPGVIEGAWSAATLPQPGVRGDFGPLDAIEDLPAEDRWLENDVGLAGLDLAYRKRVVPSIAARITAPIADWFVVASGLGTITMADASVDFTGTENEVISGVESRVVDWDDGTPPETVDTGLANQFTHVYARHGTYHPVLTATNSHGLSSTTAAIAPIEVVVPPQPPVAGFSVAPDEGDESGLTMAFTDTSTCPFGEIASGTWDFGDGSPTSAATNPTHMYAEAGTYHVVRSVVSDTGDTDTFEADITVPTGGGGGDPACDISTVAANDDYVQGDDFAGGNPPLPAYVNTAALDAVMMAGTREAYDGGASDPVNDGISHSLDTGVLYNGHPTLKMVFGVTGPFPVVYRGVGWQTVPTDDRSPEGFYPSPLFGPEDLWTRLVWRPDAGLVSASGTLLLVNPNGSNVDVGAYQDNNDHLWLFHGSRLTAGGSLSYASDIDLGPLALLLNGDGFLELILRVLGDSTGHTLRLSAWAGPACGLAGASAVHDASRAANVGSGFAALRGLAMDKTYWMQYNFSPVGALKQGNVGLWEQRPLAAGANANPYGLVLP